MRAFVLVCLSSLTFAAPTVRLSGDPTAQQAIFVIDGLTGTTAQCTAVVYLDSALTVKSNDTNEAIFTGSEACPRPYNIVEGKRIYAVLGRRTSEAATCSSGCSVTAGTLVSRSLQAATAGWLQVCDTAASSCTAGIPFVTANLPWSDTHPELPGFNIAGYGHRAYPTIDSSEAGRAGSSIDPMTGVLIRPAVRQMKGCSSGVSGCDDSGNELAFATAFDIAGTWTNPLNGAPSTGSTSGPFASTSSNGALFLPFSAGTNISDQFFGSDIVDDFRLNLYGSGVSSTANDRTVLACNALEFAPSTNLCTSAEIEVLLPQTTAARVTGPGSYPSYRFSGWNFPIQPDLAHLNIQNYGAVACTSSSCVITNTGYLPYFAAAGMKIKINGTWYTIATIADATHFAVSESSITTSGSMAMGNAGIRIRKKTSTGSVSVAATYSYAYSQVSEMPANGQRDFCSTLTFPVTYLEDGTTALSPPKNGRLCVSGTTNVYIFMLLDDGTTRYIGPLEHGDASFQGVPPSIALGTWSPTDPFSLITIHTDDSGTAGLPERINRAFYTATYDPTAGCNFRHWTGNQYNTVTAPSTCITWVNKTPYSAGRSINQQIDSKLQSTIPIWPAGAASSMGLSWMSGNYAVAYQSLSGQDSPCVIAVFDTRTWDVVRVLDSFSGTLSVMRWGGCHSNGMDLSDRAGNASIAFSLLTARTAIGWLRGPYVVHGPTRKSLDGGATWTSNTSLSPGSIVPFPDSRCGAVPTMIQPGIYFENTVSVLSCVDVTNVAGLCSATAVARGAKPGMNCVKLDFPDDEPCNSSADGDSQTDTRERDRWPCSWNSALGYASPMRYAIGDYFSRYDNDPNIRYNGHNYTNTAGALDGKTEKFAIRDKVSNGSTGFIVEAERFAACDNPASDPNTATDQAVLFNDHLFTGYGGSTHPNGWNVYMTATKACSGSNGWVDLSSPTSAYHPDTSSITSSHNTIGISPDGLHRTQVGPGAARTGDMPGMAGLVPDHTFATDTSSWGGVSRSSGGSVEQYPSMSNWTAPTVERRSLYWDWRHLNPDLGTGPEDPISIWGHTYTLVGGTSSVYKMSIASTVDQKIRRPDVFSTTSAFYDLSSAATGNVVSDATPWAYCFAKAVNECRTGSAVGDLYVVAPGQNISLGACITNTYRFGTPCGIALWSNAGWFIEQSTQVDDPFGARFRRISMGLTGPGAQYQFLSPHGIPDATWSLIRPGLAGGVRRDFLVKMPPPSEPDSIDRSTYVKVPVQLPAGLAFARARFGYVENGPVSSFFCTSRQEACLADASAFPFAYEQTDTLTATACASGCTVTVNAISGRVLYYAVERSANGTSGWVRGVVQVAATR